jgi:hypothetical protein
MPPGGDPAFLIFSIKGKERNTSNRRFAKKTLLLQKYLYDRVFALLFFFLLDQKETKNQERLIARPRTRSAHRAWVVTVLAALAI